MGTQISILVSMLACVACGRIGFDRTGDAGVTEVDADRSRPNVAFVTSAVTNGAFGGLAGGDAVCQNAAEVAGLGGTFRAFLSSTEIAAPDRFAGSRGWVRTDGVPVLDTMPSLIGGALFAPLERDENATRLPLTGLRYVWTGTNRDGTTATPQSMRGTCSDWTTIAANGEGGDYLMAMPFVIDSSVFPNPPVFTCDRELRLYCFEIGHDVPVAPTPMAGRIAFVATPIVNTSLGAFDAHCAAEASAAGLPGGYLAALATETTTIAERFAQTEPWRRVDGALVSQTGAALFDGTDPLTFLNQHADGSYYSGRDGARTGAPTPTQIGSNSSTCANWTAQTGQQGTMGSIASISFLEFWSGSTFTCGSPAPVRCLQL